MNAFLSNDPACWASIESTLAALACPVRSSVGANAASWASFAFDAAGGCARFAFANPFTLPATRVYAASCSGRTPSGGAGGSNNCSPDNAAGAGAGAGADTTPPVPPESGAGVPGPALPTFAAGMAGLAAAFPNGLTAGTGFVGGTAFFAATAFGPNPVVVTANADA